MLFWGRDRPDVVDIVAEPQEEAAAYLDENFEELARPGVLSFERQEIVFLRGDSNLDGAVNISDAIRTVDALFRDVRTDHFVSLVRDGGTLEKEEQRAVFGESLPKGLRVQ